MRIQIQHEQTGKFGANQDNQIHAKIISPKLIRQKQVQAQTQQINVVYNKNGSQNQSPSSRSPKDENERKGVQDINANEIINVNHQEKNITNNIIYKGEQKAYIKEITYATNQNGQSQIPEDKEKYKDFIKKEKEKEKEIHNKRSNDNNNNNIINLLYF